MINLRQLAERIDALQEPSQRLADFEDWFVSESWGSYDLSGDSLSKAIAAVHHVLYGYESGEFDENLAKSELVTAIRPFVPRLSVVPAPMSAKPERPQNDFLFHLYSEPPQPRRYSAQMEWAISTGSNHAPPYVPPAGNSNFVKFPALAATGT